jgi:hypothetical protein
MNSLRLVLFATAIGLLTSVTSAQTVATMDGHYYKLVPLKGPLLQPPMVTVIPGGATASVAQTSSCRLTNFQDGEYQPEWVTLCGPP